MRILLATDGTKHSDHTVDFISNFSLGKGDEVRVVSVVDMAIPMTFDAYAGYMPDTTEIEKASRENAARVLDETVETIEKCLDKPEVTVSKEVLIGSPESSIVEASEKFDANLIIVGSHGYSRWERLLLGSVSDSVIHHAPCSVLVVRDEKEK